MGNKVVCFDMDGTLITNTNSVSYLCSISENEHALDIIETKERNNELSWIEADYLKAKLLKGLEVKKIKEHFNRKIKVIDHLKNTLEVLKEEGFKRILITAGPIQVAQVLDDLFHFDHVYGSDYETIDGKFTGRIINHLGEQGKLDALVHYCQVNHVKLKDVIAVGDSDSDLKIFEKSGLSIALNYSDNLIGQSDHYIRTNDLNELLKWII